MISKKCFDSCDDPPKNQIEVKGKLVRVVYPIVTAHCKCFSRKLVFAQKSPVKKLGI